MKMVYAIVMGVVLLILMWAMFPLFLTGSDTVNSTTNATQYLGLAEINNLAPLLIFIAIIFGVGGLVVWWVFGKKIKNLFGGR